MNDFKCQKYNNGNRMICLAEQLIQDEGFNFKYFNRL